MLSKVKSGQPALASQFNAVVDAIIALQKAGRGPRAGQRTFIKNDSGADVVKGGVLGISGFLVSPADDEGAFLDTLLFTGVAPTLASHEYKYAVALEPIADGAVGRCALDGLVRVRLNVISSGHKWAKIDDGLTVLTTDCIGSAWIVAKSSDGGTGELWAVVRLDHSVMPSLYANYDGEAKQYLAHDDSGCLVWVDVSTQECP